jgi:hypothetical protein
VIRDRPQTARRGREIELDWKEPEKTRAAGTPFRRPFSLLVARRAKQGATR